jgi:hypothetical protein
MEKELQMTTANDRTIAARITAADHDRLAALAAQLTHANGTTVRRSDLIRQAVTEFLEKHAPDANNSDVARLVRLVHGG